MELAKRIRSLARGNLKAHETKHLLSLLAQNDLLRQELAKLVPPPPKKPRKRWSKYNDGLDWQTRYNMRRRKHGGLLVGAWWCTNPASHGPCPICSRQLPHSTPREMHYHMLGIERRRFWRQLRADPVRLAEFQAKQRAGYAAYEERRKRALVTGEKLPTGRVKLQGRAHEQRRKKWWRENVLAPQLARASLSVQHSSHGDST